MSDLYTSDEILLDVGSRETVDPFDQASIDAVYRWRRLPKALRPLQRALLATRDEIQIAEGRLGLIQLRSTWARLGLISPPTVADPDFRGALTMEVFNASASSILIPPFERIWSMHLVASDDPPYRGRYQGQQGITLPKALER